MHAFRDILLGSQRRDRMVLITVGDDSCDSYGALQWGYQLLRKDRQGTQGEDITQHIRDQLECCELKMAKDIQSNEESFCRHICDKRKTRENVGSHQKETGDLSTWHVEKAVLHNIFVTVITSKCSSHTAQVTEGKSWNWEYEEPFTVGQD